MTPAGWFLVGLVVVVPPLVWFEGKRQQKKYGKPSGRPNLAGVGLVELQRHLEPQRKVEIFVDRKSRDDHDDQGDRPDPGERAETPTK